MAEARALPAAERLVWWKVTLTLTLTLTLPLTLPLTPILTLNLTSCGGRRASASTASPSPTPTPAPNPTPNPTPTLTPNPKPHLGQHCIAFHVEGKCAREGAGKGGCAFLHLEVAGDIAEM